MTVGWTTTGHLCCAIVVATATSVSACASGEPGTARDGGPVDSGALDTGAPDTGGHDTMPGCAIGEHLCPGGCSADLPDDPANGCRLGCSTACVPPAGGTALCTAGTCDFECTPPAVRDAGTCVCAPRTCVELGIECGPTDDGCGNRLDCPACGTGRTCSMGSCGCIPDAAETNANASTAHRLPMFTDAPDTAMSFDTFTLHNMADEDWYQFPVTDAFDFGNPVVTVTLGGIPAGADYGLAVWYACTSGGDATTCSPGTPDATIGAGCIAASSTGATRTVQLNVSCAGDPDSGIAFVRVWPILWTGTCAPYQLAISVR